MIFRLALRNLARHRRRSLITLSAVAVGVLALVGVRGLLDGLQGTLIDGVVNGGSGALQVHRAGWAESLDASPFTFLMTDVDAVVAKVEAVDGVVAAAPRLTFPGMISIGEQSLVARVTAIDPAKEARVSPARGENLVTGKLVSATGDVVLGTELMSLAKANLAVRAAVLSGDVDGVLNGVDTGVVGTSAAQAQGEKRSALMHIADARSLLRIEGGNEIAVAVVDRVDVDAVAERVAAALGKDYEVHSWKKIAPFVSEMQATQNAVLSLLTGVFLVVILFGVANTLLMSVMERVREIGTLIALGMRQRSVLALFVVEGALLGFVGAVVGCAIGVGIVTALGHHGLVLLPPGASLPTTIHPSVQAVFLLRLVVFAVVGAVAASFLPAWRAAHLQPAAALSST